MRNYVQFVTTPTADTPGTALLLHFDNKRYIIGNVGEGTQRAATQRGIGLLKVENVMLTGKTSWKTTGGLLGLILTVADGLAAQTTARAEAVAEAVALSKKQKDKAAAEPRRLRIHGTENLMHVIATARRFVFRKGMPLDVIESVDRPPISDITTPSWSDNNILVWNMDIAPEGSPSNARKRSHEEMSEGDNEDAAVSFDGETGETTEERIDRHSQIRKGVVSNMFDSSWQLDALTPSKLHNVKLPATIFVRTEAGKIEKYTGPLPGGSETVPDIDVLVRSPWPGALIDSLPRTKPSKLARSYIIKNHRIRGKFLPKIAIDLGVKPGPSFAMLSNGGNVLTAAGRLVTPEMVMTPDKIGGSFAVVELPTEDYIEGLLNREEWSSQTVMEGVGAIIWILGKGVLEDKRLADFRAKFSHLEHIISSEDCCPNNLAFESAAMAELKLHLVDSERFPVPAYSNEFPKTDARSESWHTARVGMKLQLEPSFGLQDNEIIQHFDADKALVEHSVKGEPVKEGEFGGVDQTVLDLAGAARERIHDPEYLAKLAELQADLPCKDAEFITLGTGSALPSKYRNVSATLMRVPGVGNYLFDCGENTLGQLKRVFGAQLPEILRDLKLIWISHLHADHHLGTASVLKARNDLLCNIKTGNERIIVASDDGMLEWLAEYSQVEDIGYDAIKPIFLNKDNRWQTEFSKLEIAAYGLSSIVACNVSHCHGALAVVLNFPNGFKVAYSGDCRPSLNFARIGEGATVLIHEATFDNELQSDAFAKRHCTTSEALYVAKKMGARRVLLTHFSQRYCKMPAMDETGEHIAIVSFDYMKCKVGDFAKLAEFRPALMKLYEEEVKEKITEEIKEEAKAGIKEDIKEEVKEDTKKDIKAKIMEEAKEEIKDEIMEEVKEEIKDEIMEEAKEEIKGEVMEGAKEEIKDEIMEDIKEETREQAREGAKGEAKGEAK